MSELNRERMMLEGENENRNCRKGQNDAGTMQ